MVRITYVAHDGSKHVVEAEPGISLMDAARNANVAGIDADCGGCCACGTCQVNIDAAWHTKLEAKSAAEDAMLEFAQRGAPTARLSCQIAVTEQLDGLIVHMPESQH